MYIEELATMPEALLELSPQDPYSRKRELTPASCPLTSPGMHWHKLAHTPLPHTPIPFKVCD